MRCIEMQQTMKKSAGWYRLTLTWDVLKSAYNGLTGGKRMD